MDSLIHAFQVTAEQLPAFMLLGAIVSTILHKIIKATSRDFISFGFLYCFALGSVFYTVSVLYKYHYGSQGLLEPIVNAFFTDYTVKQREAMSLIQEALDNGTMSLKEINDAYPKLRHLVTAINYKYYLYLQFFWLSLIVAFTYIIVNYKRLYDYCGKLIKLSSHVIESHFYIVLAGLSFLVLLFPPVEVRQKDQSVFYGYQFFFSMDAFVTIEISRLIVQLAMLALIMILVRSVVRKHTHRVVRE